MKNLLYPGKLVFVLGALLVAATQGVLAEQVDYQVWNRTRTAEPIPGQVSGNASARNVPAGRENIGRMIDRHARSEGIPAALAHAVVTVESRYNPRARGGAGEIGLMQIKPQTARGMGFRGNASALYDPKTNLQWGMKYLGEAYRLADGDVCGTILRYNAGHAARRMNRISARYCNKVQSLLRTQNGVRSAKL
ncbi:MAG: lytic transglycosylase domain-containing protein [Fimbriimonadaceae bacterium]|nr:lytic transglycosylase domain-containing protein [Alphaproteobacteria bacterium]